MWIVTVNIYGLVDPRSGVIRYVETRKKLRDAWVRRRLEAQVNTHAV